MGAKFPHSNELALVRDLPMSLVERALPFVTVYSGRPQINILDAAPEVIAALPGITREDLNAFLAQRQASPENAKTVALPKRPGNMQRSMAARQFGSRFASSLIMATRKAPRWSFCLSKRANNRSPFCLGSMTSNAMIADNRP